jgi:hypothetical protein
MGQGISTPPGAAAGAAGVVLPVAAVAGWLLVASVTLALNRVDRPREAR